MAYNEKGEILNRPEHPGNPARPDPGHNRGAVENPGQLRRGGGAGWSIGLIIVGVVVAAVVIIAAYNASRPRGYYGPPQCYVPDYYMDWYGLPKDHYDKGERVTYSDENTYECTDPTKGWSGWTLVAGPNLTPFQ